MAVVSIDTLVTRAKHLLDDEPYEARTTGSIADGAATTVPINDGTQWVEGDVGEFDDASGDQFKVISIASNNLTVKRGHNGTSAAGHASGVTVLKNPRFGRDQIVRSLNEAMVSLQPMVWKRATTTLTAVAGTYVYDLGVLDFIFLSSVTQKVAAGETVKYGREGTGLPVVVERNHNTFTGDASPTLRFPNGFKTTTTFTTVDVTYAALLTTSDLEETYGVANAVLLGAVALLVTGKQVPRLGSDVSQGDASVSPGVHDQVGEMWRQRATEAAQRANAHLMRICPPAATAGFTDITDYYSVDLLTQAQAQGTNA